MKVPYLEAVRNAKTDGQKLELALAVLTEIASGRYSRATMEQLAQQVTQDFRR